MSSKNMIINVTVKDEIYGEFYLDLVKLTNVSTNVV